MIVLTLKVRPSLLPEVYWSHTLHDLRTLSRLYIQHEMVCANAFTESLSIVVGRVFNGDSGGEDGDYTEMEDSDLQEFTRVVNNGG